jgi:hypothetical protein
MHTERSCVRQKMGKLGDRNLDVMGVVRTAGLRRPEVRRVGRRALAGLGWAGPGPRWGSELIVGVRTCQLTSEIFKCGAGPEEGSSGLS